MSQYKPQFVMTDKIHLLKSQIIKREKAELRKTIGTPLTNIHPMQQMFHNARIRAAYSTLAIEKQSPLTLEQVTDIIEGKDGAYGTPSEICAVKNAYEAYSLMHTPNPIDPFSTADMLYIHRLFMTGLTKEAGCFRFGSGKPVLRDVDNLMEWVKTKTDDEYCLVKSCVFHYKFMTTIRPFEEGNGLVARMWQNLLLAQRPQVLGSRRIPIMDFMLERRQEYYDVLAMPDKAVGSVVFVEYMLQMIRDALCEFYKDPYG
ncbi:MAG: Fic family protein [Defluviitaleaceae bacterium]|nr:Fic family protein [Defluviitaleaceae bacterium]